MAFRARFDGVSGPLFYVPLEVQVVARWERASNNLPRGSYVVPLGMSCFLLKGPTKSTTQSGTRFEPLGGRHFWLASSLWGLEGQRAPRVTSCLQVYTQGEASIEELPQLLGPM